MTNEYVAKTQDVTLECGKKITVKSMTIEWWFYFLLPKIKSHSIAKLPPNVEQKVVKEIAAGNVTAETLGDIPMSFLEIILEAVIYFVGESKDWCLKNLSPLDFLLILNTFLKLSNVDKLLHFFVEINRQFPIMATMLMRQKTN